MLFVVDVGNTNIVLGVYENDVLLYNWRIRTIYNITEDELNLVINGLFSNVGICYSRIVSTIISSVVPNLNLVLNFFCNKYLKHEPFWVDAKSYKYMPILIKNPEELGADRIANSVAAYSKYKRSLIIVDFGTATTFDVISSNGEYLGGSISPGITVALEALFKRASKLSRIDIFSVPEFAIGKDTASSIQSGIIFGYASLVDGLVSKLAFEMSDCPLVISTGGIAPLMSNVSKTIEITDLLLTLDGLLVIFNALK